MRIYSTERNSASRAFTLIETLVAITILMISVVGPLTVAHKGLFAAIYAKEQITAFYLAQDAIEYIRSVRDGNILYRDSNPANAGWDWLAGLSQCVSGNGLTACTIDTRPVSLNAASSVSGCGGTCPQLKEFVTGNQVHYGYGPGGENSSFRRTVRIIHPLGGRTEEASVSVEIAWTVGGIQRNFVVRENLYMR
jgi:Tfp pilus assembly protein PilV